MDRKATLLSIAMPPLMLASFLLGFFLRARLQPEGPLPLGEKTKETAALIKDRYYGEITDEQLDRATIDGMMAALDPYCQYFTKKDFERFNDTQIKGKFHGVGILVELDPNKRKELAQKVWTKVYDQVYRVDKPTGSAITIQQPWLHGLRTGRGIGSGQHYLDLQNVVRYQWVDK